MSPINNKKLHSEEPKRLKLFNDLFVGQGSALPHPNPLSDRLQRPLRRRLLPHQVKLNFFISSGINKSRRDHKEIFAYCDYMQVLRLGTDSDAYRP